MASTDYNPNPSLGSTLAFTSNERESYGGIVAALKEKQAELGVQGTKAYAPNFAGIIQAIKDLQLGASAPPGSEAGPLPPGGTIDIDPDGNPIFLPGDTRTGELWFDTRQGRLFVAVEGQWYQTNGGDGYPIITEDGTPPSADYLIPGQFWLRNDTKALYVFTGEFLGDVAVWNEISAGGGGTVQTTATLPLDSPTTFENVNTFIDLPDSSGLSVQKDYNEWVYNSVTTLADSSSPIVISDAPPLDAEVGSLWYDSEYLTLNILYDDGDSTQWVPTHSNVLSESVTTEALEAAIETERSSRESVIGIVNKKTEDNAKEVTNLYSALEILRSRQNDLDKIRIELKDYATDVTVQRLFTNLQLQINDINYVRPDLTPYATTTYVDHELGKLESLISVYPTHADLSAVERQIPSIANLVTRDYVDTSLRQAREGYVYETGGTITGPLLLNSGDVAESALDFSGANHYGRNALKFTTDNTNYTTLGTTESPYEVAWKFNSNEDFCWISAGNKVASIDRNGIAAKQLLISGFQPNTSQGRATVNTIDVGDRLAKYQTAFENIRSAVATSTDFDSLKSSLLNALATV